MSELITALEKALELTKAELRKEDFEKLAIEEDAIVQPREPSLYASQMNAGLQGYYSGILGQNQVYQDTSFFKDLVRGPLS